MIKVSILVPIYGIEKYIGKCAESLFEQTYENIEFIFINDATKDGSIEVLKRIMAKYPQRLSQVRIFNHEINKGLSGARNTGIMNFTGDYVLHVDGDDFLEKNAVKDLVELIAVKPVDIVVFDYYSVTKSSKKYNTSVFFDKKNFLKHVLLKECPPTIWNKMYSAKLYRSGFDTLSVQGINHGEDYATTPRLLYYSSSMAKLNKPLYNYVQYNEGSYTKNLTFNSVKSMMMADEKLFNFFYSKSIETLLLTDILYVAKLRTKTALFKRCGIDLYPFICDMYNDISQEYIDKLKKTDRILLFFAKKRWMNLLYISAHMGLKFKCILKN